MRSTLADNTIRRRVLLGHAVTILFGVVLIALLVPVMQWLDRGSVTSALEMDVPSPGAVGLIVALVLVNAAAAVVARRRLLPAHTFLTLYIMLSVALPFCNVGLVQGFYSSFTAVASEHLDRQIPTIQRAYQWQDARFFPKLDEDEYQEYLALYEQNEAGGEQALRSRDRQREILRPLKRYWAGTSVDPKEKERYEKPRWGARELGWPLDVAWRMRESFRAIPGGIWRPVLTRWFVFLLLALLGTMCLAQILQRDWTERENLPFPIAQLPLALIDPGEQDLSGSSDHASASGGGGVLTNSYFCGAAGVAVLLMLLGGLAHYQILNISMDGPVTFQRIDFRQIFTREPWSYVRTNMLYFSPLMVGIALMVHRDILRGVAVLFLGLQGMRFVAGVFEPQISDALGRHWPGNIMPHYMELGTGAVVVFALVLLWRSRQALFPPRKSDADSGQTYLPRRWAGPGLLLSAVGMAAWWYMLGLSGVTGPIVILFVLLWTLLTGIALSRARTEGGLPLHSANVTNQLSGLRMGGGTTFGFGNLLALCHGFFLCAAALPGLLATQLEGVYLARRTNVSGRLIAVAVAVGFVASVGVGLLSFLTLCYWHGYPNLVARSMYWHATGPFWTMFSGGDVSFRHQFHVLSFAMIFVGAAVMIALLILRKRYPRFPLPPLCFVLVCLGTVTFHGGMGAWETLPMNFIWGPVLIAYIIKSLVLRFGGMDLYVRAYPAALGLIFGHAMMMVFWSVYHAAADPPQIEIFAGLIR